VMSIIRAVFRVSLRSRTDSNRLSERDISRAITFNFCRWPFRREL
jgi:hypothetical protein